MNKELKQMSLIDLKKVLAESRRKYLSLRIRKNANELENLSVLKVERRHIARILTHINMSKGA